MYRDKSAFLDDIARMAGGAASLAGALKEQIREEIKIRVEDLAARLDYVSREEHEQLRDMVIKLYQKQDELKAQMDSLSLNAPSSSKKKKEK